ERAVAVFMPAWIIASLSQPISAVAFVTDGIHWGTGDYPYMRNGMIISTIIAGVMLYLINPNAENAFTLVWLAMVLWILIRAIVGIIRVYPGIGNAPIGNQKVKMKHA